MQCKNCKYWNNGCIDYETNPTKKQYGMCGSHKFDYYDPVPNTLDMCLALDAEGYDASVLVGPDFGCIHWEPKNTS